VPSSDCWRIQARPDRPQALPNVSGPDEIGGTYVRYHQNSNGKPVFFWPRRYLSYFQRYNYFRFRRPYRCSQLSVAVTVICRHFRRTLYGHKPQICRWNFTVVDISSSGFGIIAIVFRSLLQSPRNTFCELSWTKTPGLALEFSWYLSYFRWYKYFRFGRPYCLLFPVVFEITVFDIAVVDFPRFATEKK